MHDILINLTQICADLLDQDSEMQKALRGVDSETESAPSDRPGKQCIESVALMLISSPVAFPPMRSKPQPISPARPLSWNSHSNSHSVHNLPFRRRSEDFDNMCKRLSCGMFPSCSYRSQLHERARLYLVSTVSSDWHVLFTC